jgi:DNA mismatch endonuclease (patch repair protein)
MTDNLTPLQRSWTMSRIRDRDTAPERRLRSLLFSLGLRFRKNVGYLPGRPDIVFPRARVAVFVNGTFWHGWRYPAWAHKLAPYWRKKIEGNRRRDRLNGRRLRRLGWLRVNVWEHKILADSVACASDVASIVKGRSRVQSRG